MKIRQPTEIVDNVLVRHVAHSGSKKIHALLAHFRAMGLDYVPEPLSLSGEVEELSFLPGVCFQPVEPRPPELWRAEHLETLGAMVRDCHDASAGVLRKYGPKGWFPFAEPCTAPEVICHNDLGPWNIPVVGDRLGIIDWEMAAPGRRIWDIAHIAWNWVPFYSPQERSRMGAPSEWQASERLGRLLNSYGAAEWTRQELLIAIVERQERAIELIALARSSGEWLLANWGGVDEQTIVEDRDYVKTLLGP